MIQTALHLSARGRLARLFSRHCYFSELRHKLIHSAAFTANKGAPKCIRESWRKEEGRRGLRECSL